LIADLPLRDLYDCEYFVQGKTCFAEKKEHYLLCFMVIEDHQKHEQNEDIAWIDLAAFRDILFLFLFYLNLLFLCNHPQSHFRGDKNTEK